jgi:hypothetical protein
MKYSKPEVNALGDAASVIQDFTKQLPVSMDSFNPSVQRTLQPAYDLDE